MRNLLVLIVCVVVISFLVVFLENRSREVETASLRYETCVERETGQTPAGFYASHGYYPDCN